MTLPLGAFTAAARDKVGSEERKMTVPLCSVWLVPVTGTVTRDHVSTPSGTEAPCPSLPSLEAEMSCGDVAAGEPENVLTMFPAWFFKLSVHSVGTGALAEKPQVSPTLFPFGVNPIGRVATVGVAGG